MKKILLSVAVIASACAGFSQAPCTDLFFSEYIEGSGQNKALEVYNPTSSAIDLSNYHIYRYVNGGTTPGDTLIMAGMLAPGTTYNIVDPDTSVSSTLTALADTLHTVTFFNGNDPLYLFHGSNLIDVIGVSNGSDIGAAGWTVGTGSTVNHTLVRKSSVFAGTTNWNGVGIYQWDSYAQNDFTHFGAHTMAPCSTAAVIDEIAWNVSIFPNPTQGQLNITSEVDNYSLQVIDLTGKAIISRNNLSQNTQIDLSDMPSGIYMVKLNNGATQLTRKIIVRK